MPITFSSEGGFLAGTISSSGKDIFIQTSASAGTLTVGNLQLTGSVIEEQDGDGVTRFKKTFNTDGSITEQKFNLTGTSILETRVRGISGVETIQSASATNNQIQFHQTAASTALVLSGSDPRLSIQRPEGVNGWQSIRRAQRNFFLSSSVKFAHGLSKQGDYYFSPADSAAGINDAVLFENNPPFFMISQSGDVVIKGGKLIAEEYVVSSSVTNIQIQTNSGSTEFGDSLDDTHQFTGSLEITGSLTLNGSAVGAGGGVSNGDDVNFGDISASGDLFKTKFVQMTNSSSVIDTFNTGSFRSAKYTLQVTSASNYQVSEMLVLHNDGTALNTEYAQINSGLNLVNFTTDVNNSNLRLNASGDFISCSVRLDRTIIPT